MLKTLETKSAQLTMPSAMYQKVSSILINSFPYIPSDHRYNITICHEKKFIWFRVAKVGTRTIFEIFEKANLKLDANRAMWCHYPVNLYGGYLKFAFVRNPWDRLVSSWYDKVVKYNYFKFSNETRLKMQDFNYFVDHVSDLDINKCDHHICLQSKLIDLNNIDYIGRFENFESDLSEVMQILKIGEITIEKRNASINKSHYKDYYDESLIQKVAKIYYKDIKMFSYDF
jgi:hypothetical protein